MAVDTLQSGARAFVARKKVAAVRVDKAHQLTYKTSMTITRFFRYITAKSRGVKIRQVTHKFRRESAAAKIQRCARRLRAVVIVTRRMVMVRRTQRLMGILNIQRIVRGFVARHRADYLRENEETVSELFLMARKRDEDGIEQFISFMDHEAENSAKPNDTDHKGNTLLSVAAELGLLKVIKKCLVWGTDPNIKNNKGFCATDIAVVRQQGVAAEYLLSKKSVSVHIDGKTLLHESAEAGMVRVVDALLSLNNDVDCKDPITQRTPLQDCVLSALAEGQNFFHDHEEEDDGDDEEQMVFMTRHAAVLTKLLEKGGDPSVTDDEGNQLVHLCAKIGNKACMEALIANDGGKSLLTKDTAGRTAWVIAALQGHTVMCELIRDKLATDIDQVCALYLHTLLDPPLFIRVCVFYLFTRVHWQVKMDSKLLTAADITNFVYGLTTPDTVSPKTYRDKLKSVEDFDSTKRATLIKELVATGGVPIDAKWEGGLTAYMKAAKQSNVAAFAACMKMGGDLSCTDDEGRTVLHYVCGTHDVGAAMEMLNMCINGLPDDEAEVTKNLRTAEILQAKDKKGRLPLHYAAFRANVVVMSRILEMKVGDGCSVRSVDGAGDNVIHYICSIVEANYKTLMIELGFNSHMDMNVVLPSDTVISGAIRLMTKLGGRVDAENLAQKSAVMVACECGHLNAVKVIFGDWTEAKKDEKSARGASRGSEKKVLEAEAGGEEEDGAMSKDLGLSLVFCACYASMGGHLSCLKIVCDHEKYTAAHCHAGGVDGLTALGWAIKFRQLAVLNYLIDVVGVNPTKQVSNGGGSALHAVATWGDMKMLEPIVKYNKMVPSMYEKKNQKGDTPLLAGVRAGEEQFEVCIALIKRGSNVGEVCKEMCLGWIMSAAVSQMKKGRGEGLLPKAMTWRDRKFFVMGLAGVKNVGDIAAPTEVLKRPKSKK